MSTCVSTEGISPGMIFWTQWDGYEVIEAYPEDKYLPSYLVSAKHEGFAFHALFATDVEGDNVIVVIAYRPDPRE